MVAEVGLTILKLLRLVFAAITELEVVPAVGVVTVVVPKACLVVKVPANFTKRPLSKAITEPLADPVVSL